MTQRSTILLAIVAILGVMVLALLFEPRQRATQQSIALGPIPIGFIGPLTGDAAVYGEPGRKVVALAIDEINSTGGVNGRLLELITEDGKCNGSDAALAAQRLIEEHQVEVIIGGSCSSESIAAVPIVAAAKVAMVSADSSSPELTNISPYFFRVYPSDAAQGQVLAAIAADDKTWQRVAFIQEQLDYPLGIYRAFETEFTARGGDVVREEFGKAVDSFLPALERLRAAEPDALFIDTQTPIMAERILNDMKAMEWAVPLLVSDIVPGDAATVERNALALEGALAAEFSTDETNEIFQRLRVTYRSRYSEDLPYSSYAQAQYDAAYLVRDALAAVGNDGEKIAAWSRTVQNWRGASGYVTILANGDRAGGHTAKTIRKGVVVPYLKEVEESTDVIPQASE